MRFSLIRLTDNLLLGVFKTFIVSTFSAPAISGQAVSCLSLGSLSIVCAGVLVICLVVDLAFRHAPSLTSSLNLVEVETLPSE
jgi:hypothetical protein